MHLIRGLHNFHKALSGAVVTMGNFDGLHLGHQSLLSAVRAKAKMLKLPSVVILFEPQPQEFFQKKMSLDAKKGLIPARLMRFREKYLGLKSFGIDYCLCVYFNNELANLSADEFVRQILVNKLNVKAVIVGDDFRFGAKREGDFQLLQNLGLQHHFTTQQMPQLQLINERISSTKVRNALLAGDMELAKTYIGKPYRLLGKVAHGDKRGRELGFPTANIFLHHDRVALSGIYAVNVFGANATVCHGVAYVGTRPMFNGTRVIMEVHIFDFGGYLYGKNLEVDFLHKIRDDANFDSVVTLIDQIERDIRDARAYFARLG